MPDGSIVNAFKFEKAVRSQTWAIIGLAGPSGGGKTWTALELATGLAQDGRIGLISTEGTRDLYYADFFDFDRLGLDAPYSPERCLAALQAAQGAGYRVVIFDSFSDEYIGEGGLADMAEEERKKAEDRGWTVNDAATWARPKAEHKKVIRWIRNGARCHLIFAMRAEEKVKFVKVKKNGRDKTEVEPIGYQPIAEKSFMFDMMESAMLLPDKRDKEGKVVIEDARGIPQWIKPMEQHLPLFPPDEPITRESGRLLAEWCAGGNPPALLPLRERARGAAENGDAALRAYWHTLSKAQQRILAPLIGSPREPGELRLTALEADRLRATQTRSADHPDPRPNSPAGEAPSGKEGTRMSLRQPAGETRPRDEAWWNREKLTIEAKDGREFQALLHLRLRECRNWAEVERLRADNDLIDQLDKATKQDVLGALADREKELRAAGGA